MKASDTTGSIGTLLNSNHAADFDNFDMPAGLVRDTSSQDRSRSQMQSPPNDFFTPFSLMQESQLSAVTPASSFPLISVLPPASNPFISPVYRSVMGGVNVTIPAQEVKPAGVGQKRKRVIGPNTAAALYPEYRTVDKRVIIERLHELQKQHAELKEEISGITQERKLMQMHVESIAKLSKEKIDLISQIEQHQKILADKEHLNSQVEKALQASLVVFSEENTKLKEQLKSYEPRLRDTTVADEKETSSQPEDESFLAMRKDSIGKLEQEMKKTIDSLTSQHADDVR